MASNSKRAASLAGETSEEKQRRTDGETDNADLGDEDINDVTEMFRSLKGLMKTMIADVRSDIRSVEGQVEAATAVATEAKHAAEKAVADVTELKKEVEEIKGPGLEQVVKKVVEESFPGVADPWTRASAHSGRSQVRNPGSANPEPVIPKGREEKQEWKLLFMGFNKSTQNDHIKDTLEQIKTELDLKGVVECAGKSYRSTQGTMEFEDKNSMLDNLKEIRKKAPYKTSCQGKDVSLEVKIFRSAGEQSETKELRTLTYVIRNQMQFTGRDRNIIDIDLGAKAVCVGNETIAEFLDNGRQLKGKLN